MTKRWDVISKIILDNRLSLGAEIGVQSGENIEHILSLCPDFKIFAIDCWDPTFKYQIWPKAAQPLHEQFFEKVLARFPNRIQKIKAYSSEAVLKIADHTLDLVFLDASHDFDSTKNDILSWLPKIRHGGFIGGHDYDHPNLPGVKKAVDEVFQKIDLFPDFVWFVKV